MTCRLIPDVIDFARGVALDRTREDAVTAHLRTCASCVAVVERERALSTALRRLANDVQPEPTRVDEIRLGRLLARFDAPRLRVGRTAVGIGLSLAASLLVAAGLYLGRKNEMPPTRVSQFAATPPAPSANAVPAEFVVLPGATALPHFERGEVIRVDVPSAGGAVQVEVLIGQDGLARAARLVSW
jgi:hypothetical protein